MGPEAAPEMILKGRKEQGPGETAGMGRATPPRPGTLLGSLSWLSVLTEAPPTSRESTQAGGLMVSGWGFGLSLMKGHSAKDMCVALTPAVLG